MFDLHRFVADCRAALAQSPDHRGVREVVARAVADPDGVLKAMGEPRRAQVDRLHVSKDLVVLNVVWAPYMTVALFFFNFWSSTFIFSYLNIIFFDDALPFYPASQSISITNAGGGGALSWTASDDATWLSV